MTNQNLKRFDDIKNNYLFCQRNLYFYVVSYLLLSRKFTLIFDIPATNGQEYHYY